MNRVVYNHGGEVLTRMQEDAVFHRRAYVEGVRWQYYRHPERVGPFQPGRNPHRGPPPTLHPIP